MTKNDIVYPIESGIEPKFERALQKTINVFNKYKNCWEFVVYYYLESDNIPEHIRELDARRRYEIKLDELYEQELNKKIVHKQINYDLDNFKNNINNLKQDIELSIQNLKKSKNEYEKNEIKLTKEEYKKIVHKQIMDEWELLINDNNNNL